MTDKFILSNFNPEEVSDIISEQVLAKVLHVIKSELKRDVSAPVLLKPREAAQLISMSESFVRKLVREGKLSASYPGSDLMIIRSELLEYIESRTVKKNPK